jgi:predicted transposase/invertase (TIGR01784 family)
MHRQRISLTPEEARKKIRPTSDVFARYLLSSPKCTHFTKSFINAVLEDAGKPPVTGVRILSPFNLKECIYDKESVMDVKVSDENGVTYDVEIQTDISDSFWNRMTYYNNSAFNGLLKESDHYDRLTPAVVIALLSGHIYGRTGKVLPGEKMHHCSLVVHEDNHDELFYPYGDPERYHILELDRFDIREEALYTVKDREQRRLSPALFRWLRFFREGSREDFMKQYRETDTEIAEAKTEYERFLTDDQLRDAQLRHEMWLHDRAQAKVDARKEGLAEGRAEGRAQGKAEERARIAQSLLNAGISVSAVASCTGLTEEELKKFRCI